MLALHKLSSVLSLRHTPSWILLSMAAGAVNAGAYLACQRFVSHVTGTVTHIAISAERWDLVVESALLFGCFVLGAMTSVLAIEGRFHRGRRPLYAVPLLSVVCLLTLVAALGGLGCFGPLGSPGEEAGSLVLLALLAFAMGLQNAAVATSTGQVVRTTHLTGPATDLGVHVATCFFTRGEERRSALRHALLRLGKVAGFLAGVGVMVVGAGWLGFWSFLLPAALVLTATALSFLPAEGTLAPVPPPLRRALALPST